jgi:hypothetical protein
MMNNTPCKVSNTEGYENSSFIIHHSSLKKDLYVSNKYKADGSIIDKSQIPTPSGR